MSESKETWSPIRWDRLEEIMAQAPVRQSVFKPLKSPHDQTNEATEGGAVPPGGFKALWGQREPDPQEAPPPPPRSIDFDRELEEARQAGWNEGYALAQSEAQERENAQDRIAQALVESLKTLAASRSELITKELAEQVGQLGFEIAKTAFGPPQKPKDEHWAMLVNSLFDQLIAIAGPAQILAHPQDLPSVKTALETLAQRWPDELNVTPDDQIQRGALRLVRGPFGAEASFEARLKAISQSMKGSDELSD